MTTQEFNALPLEARRFIESNAGCLSCGNSAAKLTRAYELYLRNRDMSTYIVKGGGVNYATETGEKGVLYRVKPDDSPFEIREKLRIAAIIHEKAPQYFLVYDEVAIAALLESLPAEEIVNLGPTSTDWIDTKTADYDELKEFAKAKGLEPASQKKVDLIAAIDALQDHNDLD